jgi:asparagine synthase (glutamine-hydrolysing)
MCGITGVFAGSQDIETREYYKAHLTIRHRGPDDEGFIAVTSSNDIRMYKGDDTITAFQGLEHIETLMHANLIFGHRRLSIIDVSERGHQPFADEQCRYFIVYNGEVYNYLELKKELEGLGYNFHSTSDTEVVLKAFIQWGNECFNKFNGMWALAIYDKVENKVILSRDRFGVKPLYYSVQDRVLLFASEMKFIKSFSPSSVTLNQQAARDYVERALLSFSEQTFWEGIKELQPGHVLECQNGNVKSCCYWQYRPSLISRNKKEALEQFGSLFEDSLRLRMRSDVEVGTLLSGGLDSNLIVFELFRIGAINKENFKSFSAVFKEEEFSEKRYIDLTTAKVPLQPQYIYPQVEDFMADFSRVLYANEEPIRSMAVYSQFLIYQHIQKNTSVKVVLNGQGADELFGGYSNHYYIYFGELLKSGKLSKLSNEMKMLHRNRGASYRDMAVSTLRRAWRNVALGEEFNTVTFQEILYSALREYLRYDDRNSMAFGVEARAPFLDYRLVEFAFGLEMKYKIDNFQNKKIEREYAQSLVPQDIVQRKDKMGFISPQERWQREYLLENFKQITPQIKTVLDRIGSQDLMKVKVYKEYLENKNNQWFDVWRLFCMNHWLEDHSLL